MTITIGIDPHKATHTAVAVDTKEAVVGEHEGGGGRGAQGPGLGHPG